VFVGQTVKAKPKEKWRGLVAPFGRHREAPLERIRQAAPIGARLGMVSPVKIRGFTEDRSRCYAKLFWSISVSFFRFFRRIRYAPSRRGMQANCVMGVCRR
jgi:hypothetical protein